MALVPSHLFTETELSRTLIDRLVCQKGQVRLDLSLCVLKEIPLDAIIRYFGTPQNMDLDLSFNFISYITPRFALNMSHLTTLDLSRNELSKLPENFGELKELVYLDIRKNSLKVLPLSMAKMTKLEYLDISHNDWRPPLRDWLEKMEPYLEGMSMAKSIIGLLQDLSKAAEKPPPAPTRTNIKTLGNLRKSQFPRRRSVLTVTTRNENELVRFADGLKLRRGVGTGTTLKKSKKSLRALYRSLIVKGLTILLAWVILGPIFVAYVAETSCFDNLAKRYPAFDLFWTRYRFKMLQECARSFAYIFPKDYEWIQNFGRSPPKPSVVQQVFNHFQNILGGMWDFVSERIDSFNVGIEDLQDL